MVISLEATKINPIFAPVIRQVKSGCGRFFVYRNPVPFPETEIWRITRSPTL